MPSPHISLRRRLSFSHSLDPKQQPLQNTFGKYLCAGIAAIALSSVARAQNVSPALQGTATYDPAESLNRSVFAVNRAFDDYILKPVSEAYQTYVPEPVATGVSNVATNFEAPRVFVNDVLQGNMSRAANTAQRFTVNSTVGVAGIVDVATTWDLPHHDTDFGTTLGVWGVDGGPEVQLPLFGHSNVRDVVGKVVDSFANPLSYVGGNAGDVLSYAKSGSSAADMMSKRATLRPQTDGLERSSDDYYATLRSFNAQRRAREIEEAKAGHVIHPVEQAGMPARTEVTVGPVEVIGPLR